MGIAAIEACQGGGWQVVENCLDGFVCVNGACVDGGGDSDVDPEPTESEISADEEAGDTADTIAETQEVPQEDQPADEDKPDLIDMMDQDPAIESVDWPLCTPGSRRCEGTTSQLCNESGSQWQGFDCAILSQVCAPDGGCVDEGAPTDGGGSSGCGPGLPLLVALFGFSILLRGKSSRGG
jgi:hypothetical protein